MDSVGFAYLLVYIVIYGLPILGGLFLFFIIFRVVFKGKTYGLIIAALVVVILPAIPYGQEQMKLRRDLQILAEDETYPENLSLEPGRALLFHDDNHAGVTCGYECPDFTRAAFITAFEKHYLGWGLQSDMNGNLSTHDLWHLADGADRDDPFPYKYAILSVPVYHLPGFWDPPEYEPPIDWPETGKAAFMLMVIPADGILDFNNPTIHYRRFNLQRDMSSYPFMGFVNDTVQTPSVLEMAEGLIALQPK